MRFVDEATITTRSGKGGGGAVSFRREKYIPKGGPDGGDGGKGGDVIFRASESLLTLYDLRLRRVYEAKNGGGGMGRQKFGPNAPDLVIEVPVGTQIHQLGPGRSTAPPERPDPLDPHAFEPEEEGCCEDPHAPTEIIVADLVEDGREFIACRGGRGGKGNAHFATSTHQTPRFAQPGEYGEEKTFRLELKVLADVGLIGLPNAGKSTFLSAVSRARPKIAPYPFTTLSPNLGVLENDLGDRLVLADIPGLIEGAGDGVGLGHQFLRHVERTKLLVHILSAEDVGPDGPLEGFSVVDEELRRFDEALAERPQLRVINKIDLLSDEQLAALRTAAKAAGRDMFLISALRGDGMEQVMDAVWRRVLAARRRDGNKGDEME